MPRVNGSGELETIPELVNNCELKEWVLKNGNGLAVKWPEWSV